MRCADDQRISFHMICRRCRFSEQHLNSNRGRFLCQDSVTYQIGVYVTRVQVCDPTVLAACRSLQ
jgi:hypothetical protein